MSPEDPNKREPKKAGADQQTHVQDRAPNFREGGKLYLVRCFACEPEYGRENYLIAVATGRCAWCGWRDSEIEQT